MKARISASKKPVSLDRQLHGRHHRFRYVHAGREYLLERRIEPWTKELSPVGDQAYRITLNQSGVRDIQPTQKRPRTDLFDVVAEIELEALTNRTGIIIINSTGLDAEKEGRNGVYADIGAQLVNNGSGSFVMYSETRFWKLLNKPFLILEALASDLEDTIGFCLENSMQICGSSTPKLYLSGYSAGAGAAAVVAHKYPQVEKMLLIAPSSEGRDDLVNHGISKFAGELFLVHGTDDHVISSRKSKQYANIAANASKVHLNIVEGCAHTFSKGVCAQAFRQAYIENLRS